jgi:hypothetical protein
MNETIDEDDKEMSLHKRRENERRNKRLCREQQKFINNSQADGRSSLNKKR